MSVLLAALLLLAFVPVSRFYRDRWSGWLWTAGWCAVVANLARAVLGHAYRMDRLPLRRFDIALEDDRARPGESFSLVVSCEARRACELAGLSAELRCIDVRSTAQGKQETVLYTVRKELAARETLARGDSRSFPAVLTVPPGARSSYKDTVDRVRWKISLSAELASWGRLEDEFEVTVAPV